MNWNDREWCSQQFAALMGQLQNIQKEINIMAVTQAQFDTLQKAMDVAITGEDSVLAQLLTLTQQILAKAQQAGVDLTAEAADVQAVTTDVATQTSNINAAVAAINAALNPPAAV